MQNKVKKKILLVTKLVPQKKFTTGSEQYFFSLLNILKNKYSHVKFCCLGRLNAITFIDSQHSPDFLIGHYRISPKLFITNLFFSKIYFYLKFYFFQLFIFDVKKQKILCKNQHYIQFGKNWEDPLTEDEQKFVRNIISKMKYDVIIINYTNLANIFDNNNLPYQCKKINLTNDIWYIRKALFEQKKLYAQNYFFWNKEKETEFLNKADIIVAIQKNEKKILKSLCPLKKVIYTPVPYEQKFDINKKTFTENTPIHLICVGGYSEVNASGITYFIDKVMPTIVAERKDIFLNIYGNVCSLLKSTNQNIFIHGCVDKLFEPYINADIAIVSLLAGTGLKVKLVEALAYGLPVVSTNFGLEGCETSINRCAFLAKDSNEFAQYVLKLASDIQIRKKMAFAAQEYFQENFLPQKAFQELENCINDN